MSGKFDQAAGKVKKATGDAIGNERRQAEGRSQNSEGHASDIASHAQGLGKKTKGALSGMNSHETEGENKKTAGKAQKK